MICNGIINSINSINCIYSIIIIIIIIIIICFCTKLYKNINNICIILFYCILFRLNFFALV